MSRVFLSIGRIFLAALIAPGGLSLEAADRLVDATADAGIRFQHVTGSSLGRRYLVETMSGGCAWLDFDADGHLDLYIVQAHEDVENAAEEGPQRNVLYRNRGDGTFEDVTERAGVGDRRYGNGAATGDFDNDGDVDLFVTNYGRDTLYRNRGDGTFEDITDAAGVGSRRWSTSAAFVDLDGDALLDLYVCSYLQYVPAVKNICKGNRLKKPDYCHPNRFRGAPDVLYRNLDEARFGDVSQSAGVQVAGMFSGKGLGVLPTDVDRDGDVDLIVANDSVPNIVWRNRGNLRFEDAALELGIALDPDGKALAGMGIDGGDVNADGLFDYTITNFSRETNTLFLGDRSGFFLESSAVSGIAGPSFLSLGFGCRLFDLELDGDLDIYVTCGHVSSLIEELYPGGAEKLHQPDLLFINDGKGRFTEVSSTSGAWFRRKLLGRGAAFGDYDNDGDLDAFIVNFDGPGVLLRNEQVSGNHWIGLHLRGDGASVSRDAFGAVVTVVASSGARRVFETRSAASYQAANDPRVVCGLGEDDAVDHVEVRWPDGRRERFEELAIDRYQDLKYGTGNAVGSK